MSNDQTGRPGVLFLNVLARSFVAVDLPVIGPQGMFPQYEASLLLFTYERG